MKRISFVTVLIFHLSFIISLAQAPKTWSASDIQLSIRKLNRVGSVLYIAAHPDDENTRLLSYLANEKCVRTAYLSITRGDGGQNLIGKEQGELLGLIRTQELLAARRVDGAEQFFTRANDFGFSKNPEETFAIWNHDSILADVVWVIRTFQPDVIITRFATDGSGGHGHHTASAILAGEAFDAAADPNRFPEQLKYVRPWHAKRLVYNSSARFFNPNADMTGFIKLDVGLYNPLLGKSYGEVASESRSMHKSQGFGTARNRAGITEYFKPLKGDTVITDIFQDVDFSWNRTDGGEKIDKMTKEINAAYSQQNPSASVKSLVQLYDALAQIKDTYLRERKQKETLELIMACSGLFAEAVTNSYTTAAGDTVMMTATLINRSDIQVELKNISFAGLYDTSLSKPLANNQLFTFGKTVRIPSEAALTNPYWLSMPHGNGYFTVPDQELIGKPQNEASLTASLKINIEGHEFTVLCPVKYKWVEPSDGERYRPFVVAPAVILNFTEEMNVFPSSQDKNISLRIKAGRDSVAGFVRINLPSNWRVDPERIPFTLSKKGDEQDVTFHIASPPKFAEAIAIAEATIDNKTTSKSLVEIQYDHIPVQTYYPEAFARFLRLEVKRNLVNIGYIPGAGDDIPKCLSQLGYRVTVIDEKMLGETKLDKFDAILTGIRAFNTNDRLILQKQKLMEYIRNGGNLLVQYNTNNFLGPLSADIGPYPFKISRDRVTNEEAAIIFELPEHTLLNSPNKITEKDFEGWIQERGIYFASSWDSAYAAPLGMNDPGEKPMKGSTLVAKFGKGHFIYTGLSFFRELPAGVPGAYRLFVNMIECGK